LVLGDLITFSEDFVASLSYYFKRRHGYHLPWYVQLWGNDFSAKNDERYSSLEDVTMDTMRLFLQLKWV
jgi:hypothetical protein